MSLLNGNFKKNTKPIDANQLIYDINFSAYGLNSSYSSSEYLPNWVFTKKNNPRSSIVLSNGYSAFGTVLPYNSSGSNQCLVVQQMFEAATDDKMKPPVLNISNTVSFSKAGKYSLSFYARHRGYASQVLSVSMSNSTSSPLNVPVVPVNTNWSANKYEFTIISPDNYKLLFSVENVELHPDVSIFLTDVEVVFISELPTPAPITTTPAPITTTPAPITTTPAPITTTPAPITTTPAPITTTPAPITTTPTQFVTTPAPVITTPAPTTLMPTFRDSNYIMSPTELQCYKSNNPDLNTMNPGELQFHWSSFGANEKRNNQCTAPAPTTTANTIQNTNILGIVHNLASSIRGRETFSSEESLYDRVFSKPTSSNVNPISDYYNFRPRINK